MTDTTLLVVSISVLISIYVGLRMLGRQTGHHGKPATKFRLDPSRNIIVDGSNVMYWGGEPSVLTLNRVLVALDKQGLNPIVFFDANVGYKLWDRHADADRVAPKIGVAADRVKVAPSGTTADELLLKFATQSGLRVVSNDRFLDWRVKYPKIGQKGFLVKGEWRQGTAIFRGLKGGN